MTFDASATALRRLIALGRERGYVTVAELNAALPGEALAAEMVEDILAELSGAGVNVVDDDEGHEDGETVPWDPGGPLSPSPLQSAAEAPPD